MAKRSGKPRNPGRTAKQPKAKTTTKRRHVGGKKPTSGPAPSMVLMEQFMSNISGRGHDPAFAAQQLAYDAMEALGEGAVDRAIELAIKAIEINPDCVDARMLLAEIDPRDEQSQINELQEIVECGEKSLGKRFFKENVGYFWGLIETRPYMRARASLASLLLEAGRRDEAIAHYEEMLRLNPGDNQGLRYVLLGQYLELGKLDGAQRLFDEYPDEPSAMFTWSRVLERFLAGDLDGARDALGTARASNGHVEKYLSGKKQAPKQLPDFYSPGEETEAVICMREIGGAWRQHPAAVGWLKGHGAKAPGSVPRKGAKRKER